MAKITPTARPSPRGTSRRRAILPHSTKQRMDMTDDLEAVEGSAETDQIADRAQDVLDSLAGLHSAARRSGQQA